MAIVVVITNAIITSAQIQRTSVVEHFTNTSCSVCANNNNGFYNVINNYSNTIHLSFHPSSPYRNDFFNQQNQAENDARTNFYGVYGGTPRLVVNGSVISNSNLNNTLSVAASAKSNFQVTVTQEQISASNFDINIAIKKIASENLSSALLFAGVLEDTIFQPTNNGENVHYNVFRKALSAINGTNVSLPLNIGDSIITSYSYSAPANWNASRLHTVAVLQNSDKTLINSAKSLNIAADPTGISTVQFNIFRVFPNPVKSGTFFISIEAIELKMYNYYGQLLKSMNNVLPNQEIVVNDLDKGVYIILVKHNGNHYQNKVIIE